MTGPRLDTPIARYYAHPPSTNGHLGDGMPLDSGSAHIVHNNVSHLSAENTRLLGHALGPGTALPIDPFANITDASPAADASLLANVSWRQTDAGMSFGPFAAVFSELGTDPPGFKPRKVRVAFEVVQSTFFDSDMVLAAALTTGPGTPLQATVLALATAHPVTIGTGTPTPPLRSVHLLELVVEAPQRPTEAWRSADLDAVTILPLWVWVGYYTSAAVLGVDSIESVSVWEVTPS